MSWLETNSNHILRLQEHDVILRSEDNCDLFNELRQRIEYQKPTQILDKLQLLGMDIVPYEPKLQMGYYVGVDWIDRKKSTAIEVLPKIRNVDFQKMLLKCFKHKIIAEQVDRIFFIRDNDQQISIPNTDFQLEPFIIITFLNLVETIAKKGLKSNFIQREEALDGKIKGKIMVGKYLKHGYINGHKGTVDCKYEEYGIDCYENQIIKTALNIINRKVSANTDLFTSSILKNSHDQLRRCLSAFENVTPLDYCSQIKSVHLSPMFTEYKSVLRLAQMIIRKKGVGVSQNKEIGYQSVPPFIINMALLFEMYVYALMLDKFGESAIKYQGGSSVDIPDFLKPDEQMIIDTKYKTSWEHNPLPEDVRQLSGYGRSYHIRNKYLHITDEQFTCPCLIIYPYADGIEDFRMFNGGFNSIDETSGELMVKTVNEYQKFYKLSVKLPTI